MKNILEVKDMNLWYSNFQALKNINMEIPENQITAFIGPSGCGKSTFLKSLNRMNDLVDGVKITGSIIYDNQNILDANIDVNQLRREIG
ncbi:MAG: ATP-binding cassette domain-containing protein, partial [Treponema sp.]|nr:ATP-binding cassette domain-containing protein [Treponema sp.]